MIAHKLKKVTPPFSTVSHRAKTEKAKASFTTRPFEEVHLIPILSGFIFGHFLSRFCFSHFL
jgi:hypothetical protein